MHAALRQPIPLFSQGIFFASDALAKICRFHWLPPLLGERVPVVETTVTEMAELGTRYRISPSLRSTHGQDGAVVMDIAQGRMFSLNRVGARMLELMKSGAGEPEIVEAVSQEFEANRETVEKDLGDFIATLRRQNLIELSCGDRSALSIPSI